MVARKHVSKLLASVLVALVATFASAGVAYAAPDVHGTDFHAFGSALAEGDIDVATVAGAKGETVFVTVKQGSREIAKYIPYTLGEGVTKGEGDNWTGVVTLDMSTFSAEELNGSYAIEIYSSRSGDVLLYSGSIYGVYADIPGVGEIVIGTRTIGETDQDDRTFAADETLYANNQTYRLVSDTPRVDGNNLHFAYEAYDEATTVDGVVKYVDKSGNVVATDEIPGLAYGEDREVKIPAVINGKLGGAYRTVFFRDSVIASNPGSTSFTIACTKMTDEEQSAANHYVATIQLVDENGRVIATDSVNVTGLFRYTAPSTIYKTEKVDNEAFSGKAVVAYDVQDDPVIVFNAATDEFMGGSRVVKIHYTTQPLESPEIDVTFNLYNGAVREKDGRSLGAKVETVSNEHPTATPDEKIEYNGVAYNLVGDVDGYAYSYGSGETPVVNAYYLPEGYKMEDEAEEVTIEYVNFLTGETIASKTFMSEPMKKATIETPASFTQDGVEYIRLDGQEEPISHSYYSHISKYVVYYRDKNDTLSSGTVINTIRVVYADGGTTDEGVTDGGTTTTTEGGAQDAAGTVADAAANAALQLNDARTYNVFDGEGNNSTMTNESGVDTNTERIEEEETPLASGADMAQKNEVEATVGLPYEVIVPVGIAAVLAAIAIVAFVVTRRRKQDAKQEA